MRKSSAPLVGVLTIIGKDIGEIAGVGKTGVLVQDSKDAVAILKEKKPDACIITTASLMQDLKRAFMDCAESGVNAITLCEEAFYPWNSSYKTTQMLDELAKKNGVTLCGSGYQDVLWGNLITTLAGATHTIKKITGKSSYNVEDYGIALAKAHGAGLSLEDFEKEIAAADNISDAEREGPDRAGDLLAFLHVELKWLALLPAGTHGQRTDSEMRSPNPRQRTSFRNTSDDHTRWKCDGNVRSGNDHHRGRNCHRSRVHRQGLRRGEFDQNVWTIQGEPNTEVIINRPATVELTCATIVNRIPDLIAAAPGFTTTEKMPTNAFRARDLGFYVK